MNKEPVSYLQIDRRWKNLPYQAKGETATIGGSGCGPTSAAMLISTITCREFNPVQACEWAQSHGYKAKGQGTYYGYFAQQFAAFGIECKRLNGSNAYGKPDHPAHKQARDLLKAGWYIIACMGRGLWTRSGHFIVAWWADGHIHIKDPASTRKERLNGDPGTFFRQVKYYFAVNAVGYNHPAIPSKYPATVRIDADPLNVRSGPGTNTHIIGKLHRGDDVKALSHKNGWYRLDNGWISDEYAIPLPRREEPKKEEPEKEDDDMTQEQFNKMMDTYLESRGKRPAAEWAEEAMEAAKAWGITDGMRPNAFSTKQETAAQAVKAVEIADRHIDDAIKQLVEQMKQILSGPTVENPVENVDYDPDADHVAEAAREV